ncbi:MAG: hypothetical protein ACYC1M_14520 [Armatimonadota bacterium]
MQYTLFVDESGDFESHRGQWVVAGVLFPGDEKTIEQRIKSDVAQAELPELHQWHLTGLREELGNDRANELARELLTLGVTIDARYYACINYMKRKVESPEQTYRLMLLDLVALVGTYLSDEIQNPELKLVIATRTIHGEIATTPEDIYAKEEDLRRVVEEGLAVRGLLDTISLNHENVTMICAQRSWGIALADTIANTVFNQQHPAPNKMIADLQKQRRLTIFESFGNFQRRRAMVAERDGDCHRAICIWLSLQHRAEACEHVTAIYIKLFAYGKSEHAKRADVEAVIERLWRACKASGSNWDALCYQFVMLEECLGKAGSDGRFNVDALLFRVRNMRLQACNHMGDVKQARDVIGAQLTMQKQLMTNPNNGIMLIDFDVLCCDTCINELKIEQALESAERHHKFTVKYLECWDLFCDCSGIDLTANTVRSKSNLARMLILAGSMSNRDDILRASVIIDELLSMTLQSGDYGRAEVRHLDVLRRMERHCDSVQHVGKLLTENGKPDVYMAAAMSSCLADALLYQSCSEAEVRPLVDILLNAFPDGIKQHPGDLFYRDIALCCYLVHDNRSKVDDLLDMAERCLRYLISKQPPIYALLSQLVQAHKDFVHGRIKSDYTYLEPLKLDKVKIANIHVGDGMDVFKQIRRISPY